MHSFFRGQRRTSLIHGVIHRCFLRPLTPSCPTVHFHTLSSKKYKKILPSLLSSQLSLSQSLELKKKKIPISFPHCSPPREGTILICHLYFARKNQGALEPKAAFESWEGRENLTCPVLLRARHAPSGSQRPWKDRDVSFLCCLRMQRSQGPGVLKTPLHRWPLSFRSEVCELAWQKEDASASGVGHTSAKLRRYSKVQLVTRHQVQRREVPGVGRDAGPGLQEVH